MNLEVIKRQKKVFNTCDLVAEQSKLYYHQDEGIPFDTLSEKFVDYREALFNAILYLLDQLDHHVDCLRVLELGGGSGKVAEFILEQSLVHDLSVSYTIVDLNTCPFQKLAKRYPNLHAITGSFDHFTGHCRQSFDILLGNEALDMWPGKHTMKTRGLRRKQVEWHVMQRGSHQYWVKSPFHLPTDQNYEEWIHLPRTLTRLLKKIRLGCFFQDYWYQSEERINGLRMQVDARIIQILQNDWKNTDLAPLVEKLKDCLRNEGDAKWVTFPVIPLGISDMTYSPSIDELVELGRKAGFQDWTGPAYSFVKCFNRGNISATSHRDRQWYESEWVTMLLSNKFA